MIQKLQSGLHPVHLQTLHMRVISTFFIIGSIISFSEVNAQSHEWEFDKSIRREKERMVKLDSTLVHMRTRWGIKLSWGRWYPSKVSQPNNQSFQESLSLNVWQLGCRWHFSERFLADFTVSFQLDKNVPQPDFFSILSGNDVRIEGYGLLFIPIEFGLKYHFTQKRFRPYAGVGFGGVLANGRFTEVEGNINNGFTERDIDLNGRVGFGKLSTGFDYRLGKIAVFTIDFSYCTSGKFEEEIGRYANFQGFSFHLGLTFLL